MVFKPCFTSMYSDMLSIYHDQSNLNSVLFILRRIQIEISFRMAHTQVNRQAETLCGLFVLSLP